MSRSARTPVTLIPGDGIGPEITRATCRILEAAGAPLVWDPHLAGLAAVDAVGDPMPDATVASIRRTGLALKGPLATPSGGGYRSVNVALRQAFGLYANVRPAQTIVPGRFNGIDLVLIRENTEGLYAGIEHWIPMGDDPRAAAESIALVTRTGCERIVRYAFEYAVAHGRRRVTIVHKANILKHTSGLFLEVARAVAQEYAGRVEADECIVDAMAMNLVVRPERYDVIVTTNLFGDILSDQISGLVGGLGLTPGANIGAHAALFEAVHGTAPDIAGQGVANPSALLFAGCLLLDHIGAGAVADRVRAAAVATLRVPATATRDLGGQAGTDAFANAVIRHL